MKFVGLAPTLRFEGAAFEPRDPTGGCFCFPLLHCCLLLMSRPIVQFRVLRVFPRLLDVHLAIRCNDVDAAICG